MQVLLLQRERLRLKSSIVAAAVVAVDVVVAAVVVAAVAVVHVPALTMTVMRESTKRKRENSPAK